MKNFNCPSNLMMVCIISIFFISNSFAQDKSDINRIKSNKDYKIWLYSNTGQLGNGDLLKALDDSIVLFKNYKKTNLKSFAVEDIKEIRLRRKSRVAAGMAFGAIGGFLSGLAIGYTQGDDKNAPSGPLNFSINFSKKEKGYFYGIVGIIPGALIGGLIGSIKLKIPINGNKSKYREAQDKLKSISKDN